MSDEIGRDIAGRAGPVLDDESLAERLSHLLPDDARGDVRRRAGPEPDDQADGPVWISVLRQCGRGEQQRHERRSRKSSSA